jgi:quinol monooxygenase YgiN
MVISTLRIVPSPKQHSEVREILLSVLGPTEIQLGCLSCAVYEEKGPDHAVMFRAHWETESALHEHICSEFYRRLLVACELSNRPPEVCFHHVCATQGIDLVEQLRRRDTESPAAFPEAPAR